MKFLIKHVVLGSGGRQALQKEDPLIHEETGIGEVVDHWGYERLIRVSLTIGATEDNGFRDTLLQTGEHIKRSSYGGLSVIEYIGRPCWLRI